MKTKSLILTLSLSLGLLAFGGANTTAHAYLKGPGYDYASSVNKKVITTRKIMLYHVHVGQNEADNTFHKTGYIPRGTRLEISPWIMSTGGGYVIYAPKYSPSEFWFYFVIDHSKNKDQWYTTNIQGFKAKLAKEKKAAAKKDAAKEKKLEAENQKFIQSHPIHPSQYKKADKSAGDYGEKIDVKNFLDIDSETNTIESYYAPDDPNALVPYSYVPRDKDEWDVIDKANDTKKIYLYIDANNAKTLGSSQPGWIYMGSQSL